MIVQNPDGGVMFVQWHKGGYTLQKRHLMPPRPLSRSIGVTQKYFGKKHGEVNG